ADRHHRPSQPVPPQTHHQGGTPEEWQDPNPSQRENPIVMRAVAENAIALLVRVGPAMPSLPGQCGADSPEDPRQGRMLILIAVFTGVQPLHASRQMVRFIDGVVEDGVSGADPQRGEGHEYKGREKRGLHEEAIIPFRSSPKPVKFYSVHKAVGTFDMRV